MNKDQVIARMREVMGVPFLHQGRDRSGIDCVGALAYAFDYKGDIPAYSRDPVNGELERELERIFGEPIYTKPPLDFAYQVGDVLSIQFVGPTRHVALVADYVIKPHLSMTHTSASVGKVVEHISDQKWRRRVVKVWRP